MTTSARRSLSIDLCGPYPPPYGGVSVHLERLAARLESEGDRVRLIAPQLRTERHVLFTYRRILATAQGELLHAHVAGISDKLCLGALTRLGRRVVLTVHGQSLEDELRGVGGVKRRLVLAALRRLDAVVAVNERIRNFAVGELGLPGDRVFNIPAFLPPCRPGQDEVAPARAEELLARCSPILCANAFDLSLYEGHPLYGSDLLLDLLVRSRKSHPRLGIVFYVSTLRGEGEVRLTQLHERAHELGVESRLAVVTGSRPFNPILVRSAALVRPTVTDGDAISVRDALWLGVPVVASDVMPRPRGTNLFKTHDGEDLWRVVRLVIDRPGAAHEADTAFERRDTFSELRAVYASVVERRPQK